MNGSSHLSTNFGGIGENEYCDFDKARILIFPVVYNNDALRGATVKSDAAAIINASRRLELYDEETDAEVYKIGIHTLDEFTPRETSDATLDALYEKTGELLESEKFLCMIGGEHPLSAPLIEAHAEKFHNLSVLRIAARLSTADDFTGRLKIPAVQVGIRAISADEARSLGENPSSKIYRAREIAGKTDWIDDAIDNLTEKVYLTIDLNGLDPSIMTTTGTPEPGGLGWYETLTLIKKLAEKRRVVGMDLVEYSYIENRAAPAFLCAKLVYKSLAYIFRAETPKVVGA